MFASGTARQNSKGARSWQVLRRRIYGVGAAKVEKDAKPKLRVALIGCGGISGVHIEGWKKLNPTAQIVACADPIEERRHQRGDELGLLKEARFPYLKQLLKSGIEVDAVDICANNAAHCPVTVEALSAGLHVMCEKPLATTPADVKKMIAARNKNRNKNKKLILMCAQSTRFMNSSLHLHDYLKGGVLGATSTTAAPSTCAAGICPRASASSTSASPAAARASTSASTCSTWRCT